MAAGLAHLCVLLQPVTTPSSMQHLHFVIKCKKKMWWQTKHTTWKSSNSNGKQLVWEWDQAKSGTGFKEQKFWAAVVSHHGLERQQKSITLLLKKEGVRLKIHERIKSEDRKLNWPNCSPNRTDGRTSTFWYQEHLGCRVIKGNSKAYLAFLLYLTV